MTETEAVPSLALDSRRPRRCPSCDGLGFLDYRDLGGDLSEAVAAGNEGWAHAIRVAQDALADLGRARAEVAALRQQLRAKE